MSDPPNRSDGTVQVMVTCPAWPLVPSAIVAACATRGTGVLGTATVLIPVTGVTMVKEPSCAVDPTIGITRM